MFRACSPCLSTVYEEAAAMAESDEDRSHVYAAQGIVAYKDGDEEAAKQHLFKW